MKKVARLRMPQEEVNMPTEQLSVRTTGRIKKPKAVFDPSDNYLPRSQRTSVGVNSAVSAVTTPPPAAPPAALYNQSSTVLDIVQHNKRLSQSSSTSTNTTSLSDVSNDTFFCSICLKREAKRGTSAKNKLISCLECEKRVHKLCLKVDFEQLDILRQNFKCENCISCDICDAFADDVEKVNKQLVTCAKCVKSYHLTCHIPNVHKFQLNQRNWKCNKCTLPTIGNGKMMPVKIIREIIGDDVLKNVKVITTSTNNTVKSQQPQSVNIAAAAAEAKTAAVKRTQQERISKETTNGADDIVLITDVKEKKLKLDTNEVVVVAAPTNASSNVNSKTTASASIMRYSPNESIDVPDITEVKYWNVDQVTEYISKYFPNESYVFKEHEIDGNSLLLLKRSDVIKQLPIKLGPSLRIYSLILKIQAQLNDSTLGWNC